MTFTQSGERITLEMTEEDYDALTLYLGIAAGRAQQDKDTPMYWRIIRFVNELNRTNPNFSRYKVPPKFQEHKGPGRADQLSGRTSAPDLGPAQFPDRDLDG